MTLRGILWVVLMHACIRQSSYVEPISLEPHFGQVKLAHGVPRLWGIEYPQLGHLQVEGPPIPCLCPPLPLPNPLPVLIAYSPQTIED